MPTESSRFAALRARVAAWRASDPMDFRVCAAFAVALLLLVLRLVLGDDPFTGGIAERLAEGKNVRPRDYARTYGWWAALVNVIACGVLLATRSRWLTRGPATEIRAFAPALPRMPRWLVAGTLAAVLAGGVLAGPRMTHSFWDDELFALEHAIDGTYRQRPGGELEFERARLRDTLWYFYRAANHVPQSLLSRLSSDAWRLVARPDTRFASEPAVRFPSLVAGLSAIVLLALLLARLGEPVAGLLAAWVLALHPWMLRYTSEARGYALLVVLVVLMTLLLLRVLHRGSWGRWLAFGFAQFAVLWTFSAALFVLVVANVVLAASLWWHTRGTPAFAQQAPRFVVANVLGAMLWLQIMGPNAPQLMVFITDHAAAGLDLPRAMRDLASHLWIGMPYALAESGPRFVEVVDVFAEWPRLAPLAAAATALFAALGIVRTARCGAAGRVLALVLLLPAVITLTAYGTRGSYVYMWYFMFMLPGFVVFLAMGLRPPKGRPALAAAFGLVLTLPYLASFVAFGQPQRQALRSQPLQPVRESVELTRANRDPFAPANARIVTLSFQTPPKYYDPLVRMISSGDELREWMRRADAERLDLFVNYGRPRLAERRAPDVVALLDDPDHFERVAELVGSSPRGIRRVYRYLGTP